MTISKELWQIFFQICTIVFAVVLVQAESNTYLYRNVELTFKPRTAHFFVEEVSSGHVMREPAIVLPRNSPEDDSDGGVVHWIVGAQVALPDEQVKVQASLVIMGESGEVLFIPPEEHLTSDETKSSQSVDGMRQYLLQRKELLRSWLLQVRAQQESLDRLRADADIIANLGRIVEVKEEAERTKEEAADLDKDLENLKRIFKYTKARSNAKNFVGRENQLTAQIVELNEVVKGTEAGELGRRSDMEKDIEEKLDLIEQARLEDYDGLQRELVRLRKYRLSLEG